MFVVPKSEITLGGVRFYGENSGVNAVSITQSVENIGATAKVTIPRNFARKNGRGLLDCIHVGDTATIRLGYNDNIETEFTGYITSIGDATPVVVELEDEWWQLKRKKLTRSWATATLKEVLQFVFDGWTVDDRVGAKLEGGYVINNATPYEVAQGIRDSYGFSIHLNPEKKSVLAFYPYRFEGFATHTYTFGTKDCTIIDRLRAANTYPNVVKSELKFTRKEDTPLLLTVKYTDRQGKKHQLEVGDKGENAQRRTLNLGCNINSEQEAKQQAQAELERLSYDGYSGKITGFGIPRTAAGDALKIIDPDNPEREGIYLIKSVTVSYTLGGGYRRTNELSYKIK